MSRLIPDSELLAAGDRAAAAKAAKPSARDDYPLHPQLHAIAFRQWGLMCDEIDLLRAEVAELSACLQPVEGDTEK